MRSLVKNIARNRTSLSARCCPRERQRARVQTISLWAHPRGLKTNGPVAEREICRGRVRGGRYCGRLYLSRSGHIFKLRCRPLAPIARNPARPLRSLTIVAMRKRLGYAQLHATVVCVCVCASLSVCLSLDANLIFSVPLQFLFDVSIREEDRYHDTTHISLQAPTSGSGAAPSPLLSARN